jgi:hypothetical protein
VVTAGHRLASIHADRYEVTRVKSQLRLGLSVLAAAACASCGAVEPSDRANPTSAPPVSQASAPAPSPSRTEPAFKPSASTFASDLATPAPTPPYRVGTGKWALEQEPGTIIFGSAPGGVEAGLLEPYITRQTGRPVRPFVVPFNWEVAFGAFWEEPVGHTQIRITLYRFTGGTLHLVWSDPKRVKQEATSYFDELVPFKGPGVYRLEVTDGSRLLAWGVVSLGPYLKSVPTG